MREADITIPVAYAPAATPDHSPANAPGDAIRGLARIAGLSEADAADDPLGLRMADVAAVLWQQALRFDAADPGWADRDRFVLSAPRHSFLLYALLHLTGHEGIELRDLRRFGRLNSPTARQAAHGLHPAIEASVGPPGQGLAMGAGMALAERMLAGRFGRSLVDHRIWVMAGAADLAAGVAQEAAALAGRMGLERLTVLFEETDPEEGRLHAARFAACGWSVRRVARDDAEAIASALAAAQRGRRPALIACAGASTAAGGGGQVSDWVETGRRNTGTRRGWLKRLKTHARREEFLRLQAGRLPQDWKPVWLDRAAHEPRRLPHQPDAQAGLPPVLHTLLPELVGLSARHEGETGAACVPARPGAELACGTQEHGMAGLLNGLALHGGLRGIGIASFVSVDRMRVALRLAALMRLGVIYLLADDGLSRGEDGPAFQPVEQLASLRAMPNVAVFRPGDPSELAECWTLALERTEGPSVIALGRGALPRLREVGGGLGAVIGPLESSPAPLPCAMGGYVLREARARRMATLIATGAELPVALAARDILRGSGIDVAVVSLPCWELFARTPADYRARVLGEVPRFGIEAASGFGWERWLGDGGVFIGMDGFGASAPAPDLYRHFGITPDAVADAVRRALG